MTQPKLDYIHQNPYNNCFEFLYHGVANNMCFFVDYQNKLRLFTLCCLIMVGLTACQSNNHHTTPADASTETTTENQLPKLTIYTSINSKDIQPLLSNYANQSGITIDVITDQPMSILARLKAEGDNSPADLIFTEDVGIFQQAIEENLLQAFNPTLTGTSLSEQFHDKQGYWLALSYYGRTIVYDSRVIHDNDIHHFTDLTKDNYKQKLCLTQGKYTPNIALTTYFIENMGEKKTKDMLQGWVNNLSLPTLVDDLAVLNHLEQGKCQIGLVNSHIYAQYLQQHPQTPIKLQWLRQTQGGVPINMTAVAIAHSAKQPDKALALIEWLANHQQNQYASLSDTFTLNSAIDSSNPLPISPISMGEYAEKRKQTITLMEEIGYY